MRTLGFVVLVLAAVAAPQRAEADQDMPNIVFLFADDLGYGDIGCYGHPYIRTPNIDKLADQGTRFTQFYVTGITCCPSRTGFMTGKFPASFANYPAEHGFGNRATITGLLKKRGYATGHFGKWHIGQVTSNGTYGIDTIDSGKDNVQPNTGRDNGLYGSAIEFIKANKDNPFYVNVWGHITHYPVHPREHYAERFKDVAVNASDFGPEVRKKFGHVNQLGRDVTQSMRNYCGDVSSLDDEVGRILKVIDELGIADKTIVVFSSDHGPAPVVLKGKPHKKEKNLDWSANMLGSPGPFRGGKHTMLEGGVRVPFIVRWPGKIPAGKVDTESIGSGIDWLPTLCALTGTADIPADLDGENISGAWLGKGIHVRTKPLLWRVSNPGAAVGIRLGPWKLYTPRVGKKDPTELYNVLKDPLESKNLAADHPKVVGDLTAKVKAWTDTLPKAYQKQDKKDKAATKTAKKKAKKAKE